MSVAEHAGHPVRQKRQNHSAGQVEERGENALFLSISTAFFT